MDSQALSNLHLSIQAQGFTGHLEALRELLSQAEADTTERRVLDWWKGLNAQSQHAALLAVYGHARKHGMCISTFDHADRVTLLLSRSREFLGVCLGRIEVKKEEIRWCFYRGNELVGDRTNRL